MVSPVAAKASEPVVADVAGVVPWTPEGRVGAIERYQSASAHGLPSQGPEVSGIGLLLLVLGQGGDPLIVAVMARCWGVGRYVRASTEPMAGWMRSLPSRRR
jgi:hypothetical protein